MTTPTVNPLEMPRGLTPQQQRWWKATVETITALRRRADEDYRTGMQAHYVAEHARSDYYRLRDENRARYQARGQDSYVADAAFANYQVAQDCIDAEQMYGRWSTERLAAARASYQQVTRLMDELAGFLRTNRRRVPSPRVGG